VFLQVWKLIKATHFFSLNVNFLQKHFSKIHPSKVKVWLIYGCSLFMGIYSTVMWLLLLINSPLWFDICDSSYVVLGGEHKLIVQYKLWLVIQARWRMELHNLVDSNKNI
jgi:hypothetical protein